MVEPALEAGLKSLRESLERMRRLVAWGQLKEAERKPGQPPGFVLGDSIEQDLRNEYSFFMSLALQMHTLLNNPNILNISEERCQCLKKQLLKLESQLRSLGLQDKSYSISF